MSAASSWHCCRIGFAESLIALIRATAPKSQPYRRLREEWPLFSVVEVDQDLVEAAVDLAGTNDLRTLDSLHLAAALVVPARDRVFATWDARLWRAAERSGFSMLPLKLA